MTRIRSSRRDFLRFGCGALACGGAQAFFPQLGLIPAALAGTPAPGYKALVCLYLDGGNDAWNLLLPGDAAAHAKYVTARNGLYNGTSNAGGLGIPHWSGTGVIANQTLPPSLSIGGGQYALNPFAPELAQLYNSNRMAFIANVGPLVEPTTVAAFNSRRRPPQLYSHNDQSNLWHIGSGSSVQTIEGWGGRVVGRVGLPTSMTAGLPPTITLSGQTRFLSGLDSNDVPLFPFALSTSATTPATSLSQYSSTNTSANQFQQIRRNYLKQLLDASIVNAGQPGDVTSAQAFTREYGSIVDRSLQLADFVINPAIAGIPASDPVNGIAAGNPNAFSWPAQTFTLADQLRQVARMIRISTDAAGLPPSQIAANRQIFFVRIGGFDTHDGQITSPTNATGHQLLIQRISQAVSAFYQAMVAIGRENDVTLFTASEFARTINSNGNGSDHAWGSVQFAVGGAVNGGQVYGRFPNIVLNNAIGGTINDNAQQGECFSRGQFIPTTAVDQFGASLAQWMGVPTGELGSIFPNLVNFTSGPFANAGVSPTFASFTPTIPGLMNGV
jgi:uncharacterized protein (DUF1501 family)